VTLFAMLTKSGVSTRVRSLLAENRSMIVILIFSSVTAVLDKFSAIQPMGVSFA
jgi:hypothetical protein